MKTIDMDKLRKNTAILILDSLSIDYDPERDVRTIIKILEKKDKFIELAGELNESL